MSATTKYDLNGIVVTMNQLKIKEEVGALRCETNQRKNTWNKKEKKSGGGSRGSETLPERAYMNHG